MSLLTDLFSTLDKRSLGDIGNALGESDQSVSRGIQPAIATVLAGMATKADNPALLRKTLDMAPSGTGIPSWSSLANSVTNADSPLMSAGKGMLATLFGGSEGPLTRALGAGTGLSHTVTSTLMTMAAPMVIGFLGKRVRDEGMNMGGLGTLLQREVPAIREALPAGVTDLLWPRTRETITASPVVAQTMTREKSSSAKWLVPLLVVLIPGLLWLIHRAGRPVAPVPPVITGTANRAVPEVPAVPKASLPENVDLYFETGSAKLRPESYTRLNEFAGALAANGDARVAVNGYTDNVGSSASNLRLSQLRADAVKADLIRKGIPADRLITKGLGEDNPIADNATASGRGMNRRVSVGVQDH
jgi:OOP family OmpA-OmpF porin